MIAWACDGTIALPVQEVLAPVPDYDEHKRLQEQKQKVIALIKDGRFVEALQELENESP